MKRTILIIGIVLIGFFGSFYIRGEETPYYKEADGPNRTIIHFSDSKIEVDNALLHYTESYINTAISNGMDMNELSKNFLGIYIELIPVDHWGATMTNEDGTYFVLINTTVTTENKLRLVIFHELSHYYITPRTHCHAICGDIMSAEAGYNNFYKDWEAQKAILFNTKL